MHPANHTTKYRNKTKPTQIDKHWKEVIPIACNTFLWVYLTHTYVHTFQNHDLFALFFRFAIEPTMIFPAIEQQTKNDVNS
jgi:hypothetical protein